MRATYPANCTKTTDNGVDQGGILCDWSTPGYAKNTPVGLASTSTFNTISMSAIRQSTDVKYALIHISASWCGDCSAVAGTIAQKYPTYASKAVAIELLNDTPPKSTLDGWIGQHGTQYNAGTNGGAPVNFYGTFGSKLDQTYVVDLDTMEVLCHTIHGADAHLCLEKLDSL
jgi:hypothetical protein